MTTSATDFGTVGVMLSNVRDQRQRAVGAPLANQTSWQPLALGASGVPTHYDRSIA